MDIYARFEEAKEDSAKLNALRTEILNSGNNVDYAIFIGLKFGKIHSNTPLVGIETLLAQGFEEGDNQFQPATPILESPISVEQIVEEQRITERRDIPLLTQAYFLRSLDDEGLLRVYNGLHNMSKKGLKAILNPDEKVQLPAGVLCYKRHLNQVKIPDSNFATAVQYLIGVGKKNLSGHLQPPLERYQKMFNTVPLGVRIESVSIKNQEAFLDTLRQPLQVRQHKVAAGEYSGDFWAPAIRKDGDHFNRSTRTDYAREIARLFG